MDDGGQISGSDHPMATDCRRVMKDLHLIAWQFLIIAQILPCD
jgi:hypothetical protein